MKTNTQSMFHPLKPSGRVLSVSGDLVGGLNGTSMKLRDVHMKRRHPQNLLGEAPAPMHPRNRVFSASGPPCAARLESMIPTNIEESRRRWSEGPWFSKCARI